MTTMSNHWGVRVKNTDLNMDHVGVVLSQLIQTKFSDHEPSLFLKAYDEPGCFPAPYYRLELGEATVSFWVTEDGNLEGEHGSPWSAHWWAVSCIQHALAMAYEVELWDSGVGTLDLDDITNPLNISYDQWLEKAAGGYYQDVGEPMNHGHLSGDDA